MNTTQIPYGTHCWNPVWGCTPISAGCDHCYSQAFLRRFRKPQEVTINEEALVNPRFPREPARILVGFQTDLWHKAMPDHALYMIMAHARAHPDHRFVFLTKRATRFMNWSHDALYRIPDNCWFGVTVEDAENLWRVDFLILASVPHRWLSVEPMLESLSALNARELEWVVVGKETGSETRPYERQWVQDIVDTCGCAGIPVYVKPGTHTQDGREYRQYPSGLILPQEASDERV
jgi:protein gp37